MQSQQEFIDLRNVNFRLMEFAFLNEKEFWELQVRKLNFAGLFTKTINWSISCN